MGYIGRGFEDALQFYVHQSILQRVKLRPSDSQGRPGSGVGFLDSHLGMYCVQWGVIRDMGIAKQIWKYGHRAQRERVGGESRERQTSRKTEWERYRYECRRRNKKI